MANDPNTIQYVIQEDGFWYVASKDRTPGVPEITVSAKGVANGLSTVPNDGADFGPDSYDPTHTGSGIPYTKTSGIQEAVNYSLALNDVPPVALTGGVFTITKGITAIIPNTTLPGPHLSVKGLGDMMTTYLVGNTSDDMFTVDSNTNNVNAQITFYNVQPAAGTGYAPNSFLNWNATTLIYQTLILDHVDIAAAGWGTAPVIANGIQQAFLYDYESYGGGYAAQFLNTQAVTFYGSSINGSVLLSSVNRASFYGCDPVSIVSESSGVITVNGGRITGVNINGNTSQLSLSDLTFKTNSPYIIDNTNSTAVTLTTLLTKGVVLDNIGTADIPFVSSNVTITNVDLRYTYNKAGASHTVTNFPSTSTTTPTVPASGTPQSNTNPYPVNVYIYGGTVTVIDYTPSGGSATQVGTTGPATVRLNPGDSITLTYSAAPTWNWVAV